MLPWRSRALALDARQQGKDGDLLSKLRFILLGGAADASPPPPPPPRIDPGNAGLMARLQRILAGKRKEDATDATIHLGIVAQSLARQGKIEEAIGMCREMGRRGIVPDITVISAIPASSMGAGQCLFELPAGWIPRQELSPHSSLVKLLCKGGRFIEASKTTVAMLKQGLVVETMVLNTLAYGLYKAGHSGLCFQMMASSKMCSSLDDLGEEEDDIVRRVCGALDDLIEHSVCPDVVLYNVLVDGLCAAGKIDEAYFVYKNSAAKSEYSVSTCNALVQKLVEQGRGGEAFPLVLGMLRNGLTVKNGVLNSMIGRFFEAGKGGAVLPASLLDHKSMLQGLCSLGKIDDASQFLGDMVRKDAITDTKMLDCLVVELCKAVLEKPESYKLYEGISRTVTSSSLCSASTYNILVEFLYKADRIEDVHRQVKGMLDKNFVPDSKTYNFLVVRLCKEHRVDDALLLLKRATCTVSSTTSNCVLQALCSHRGSVDIVLKFVQWMRTKDQAPDAVSSSLLIKRLIKEGKFKEAFSMYESTMGPKQVKLDKVSYDAILAGLWESGKESEAVKLFQQMVRNRVVPDATTSNILITGLCKSGKVDAALKIASILPTVGCVPELGSYKTLLSALCEQGQPESVMNLIKDINDNGLLLDLDSYTTAFLCFSRSGWNTALGNLFIKMMEQGLEPGEGTYELVFGSLTSANNLDTAWKALQGVRTAGFVPLKQSAYRPYLVALLKAGRVEEATELFNGSIAGNAEASILLECFLEAGLMVEACSYYETTLAGEEASDDTLLKTICAQNGDKVRVACHFVNELSLRRKSANASVGNVVLKLLQLKRLDLAAGMVEEGLKLHCVNSSLVKKVADGLLEENKVDDLCKLFAAVSQQQEFEIGLPRRYIRKLLTRGETDVANRIFETAVSGGAGGDIRKTTKTGTKSRSCSLYDLVITDFCKLGKYEEGANVLEHLYDNGVLPRASEL